MNEIKHFLHKIIMLALIFVFCSTGTILSQSWFFDDYRDIYENAEKNNCVVLNDWIEKNIFSIKEKQSHQANYIYYKNYLDSLIFAHKKQDMYNYKNSLNDEFVTNFHKYLFSTHYYFPVEYYNYWSNRLEIFNNKEIESPPGAYDFDLLEYIAKNLSFLDYCIISTPYILVIKVDEVIPDTVKMYHGGVKKIMIIKGRILKDLKMNKKFKYNPPIEMLCRNFPNTHSLSYKYKYESEFDDIEIDYRSIENLKPGSTYMMYIDYILATKITKYKSPLQIRIGMNKNQGIFEIIDDRLIDPYRFFKLGKNPEFIKIENLLSKIIFDIKGSK